MNYKLLLLSVFLYEEKRIDITAKEFSLGCFNKLGGLFKLREILPSIDLINTTQKKKKLERRVK